VRVLLYEVVDVTLGRAVVDLKGVHNLCGRQKHSKCMCHLGHVAQLLL
jgi:hypothetical protein